jgi:hypothetical protein
MTHPKKVLLGTTGTLAVNVASSMIFVLISSPKRSMTSAGLGWSDEQHPATGRGDDLARTDL